MTPAPGKATGISGMMPSSHQGTCKLIHNSGATCCSSLCSMMERLHLAKQHVHRDGDTGVISPARENTPFASP